MQSMRSTLPKTSGRSWCLEASMPLEDGGNHFYMQPPRAFALIDTILIVVVL